ncbi:GDSL-type esterase/lipase family protein [Sinomonas sp. P47F7]|uniref:GDSL-type esterase/lipase family protein n=1 Tax=Sinomonas sp. P47F7 TaxID=3410987 RepID=UPI003BF49CEB
MPAVSILETVSTSSGTNAPAVGALVFTPTRTFAGPAANEEVLPLPFPVTLDATGRGTANLAVTSSNWVWRVDKNFTWPRQMTLTEYVSVQSTDTSYPALTRVDPTTLTAVAASPAWVGMANSTVTSGSINSSGHLILTRTDTTTSDAGSILIAPAQPLGKVSAIGDSITATNDLETGFNGATDALYQDSWFDYACMLSGGLMRRGRNTGIAGQTSVQMAARFATDILGFRCSTVIILCGTNDVGQSVSAGGTAPDATALANFQSSIQSMVLAARAANVTPILSTVPPNNATNRHALISKFNVWIRLYASLNNLTLLDFYGQAADPTTGNYLASWASADGTHPGSAGHLMFGQYVSNQISKLGGVLAPFVPQDDADPNSLITHPMFLGGAVSAQGIPPGWQIASGYGTGLTVGYVTDSAVKGNMWQVQAAASSAPYYVQFPIPAASWSVGDRLAVCGILTCNGGVLPGIAFADQAGARAKIGPSQPVTHGYFYMEQIVAPTSTSLYLDLNTPAGTGTWSVGQLGVYNLTKLGFTS